MLEWIISSSVLIAVVMLLRFALKGKISLRLQYALWALVLVRLLIPVSFGSSSISVMNSVAQSTVYQTTSHVVSTVQVPSDIIWDSELTIEEAEQVGQGTLHRVEGYPAESGRENLHTYSFQDSLKEVGSRILCGCWITGIVILGLWFVVTNALLAVKLRKGRTSYFYAESSLPIYISDAVDTPCLFGLFRPAIYLTSEATSDETVIRHAVEHELTHYRHRDNTWSILRCVCLAIHWYNPLVWCAAMLSRNDAELACDEATIRRLGEDERAAYGRTLIGLTCEKRTALFNIATTMTGSGRSIRERIALIVKKPKMAVYTLVAVLLIAAIAVGCTFTGAKKENKGENAHLWPEDTTITCARFEYAGDNGGYKLITSEVAQFDSLRHMNLIPSEGDFTGDVIYRLVLNWNEVSKGSEEYTILVSENSLSVNGQLYKPDGFDFSEILSYFEGKYQYFEYNLLYDEPSVQTDLYSSMEDYVNHRMELMESVSYYSAATQDQATVTVLDARIGWLEKRGEVFSLAPNGTLEAWSYNILVKPDTDPEDIMLVGGQYDEDGYFDLEGQGGRITVALRDTDGNYDVLYDAVINDGMDFFGYCNTTEEAIHDWYVKQYGLDLPLYATDWIDSITVPDGRNLGNFPVHRFDGDGWYIYIPVQAWNCPANAETPCVFSSAYYTGSTLKIEYFDHAPEEPFDDHRRQGDTLTDEEKLLWVNTQYYYYDAQDGGCWRITIEWIDANLTNYPYIMEPDILRLMAESFTVCGSKTVTTLPVLELSREEYDAVCRAVMIDLKSGWWKGGELVDCTYEASAFECVYRETVDYYDRFYGYAGYFRFDENGNCVEYWYAPSIVTIDAVTKQIYNAWWPGDGAYHEMDILARFPDEIAEFVAEPNEERYQVIRDRLLTIAKGRMVSETPQDVVDRLGTLTAEDIKYISTEIGDPGPTKLAQHIGDAMNNIVDRTEDIISFWSLEIYFSAGQNGYSSEDEWLAIYAGPEENIVQLRYHSKDGKYTTLYCENGALYSLIRGLYYTEPTIDRDAFARFGEILSARAQAQVDSSKLSEGSVLPYTGYEIVYLAKADEFTQDGEQYEIYEWDVAFLHEDPIRAGLAGGMWIDSELRIRGLELETYFVARTSGDLVDYQFFFYDLYFGPDEETGKVNAHANIIEMFHSSQDV